MTIAIKHTHTHTRTHTHTHTSHYTALRATSRRNTVLLQGRSTLVLSTSLSGLAAGGASTLVELNLCEAATFFVYPWRSLWLLRVHSASDACTYDPSRAVPKLSPNPCSSLGFGMFFYFVRQVSFI